MRQPSVEMTLEEETMRALDDLVTAGKVRYIYKVSIDRRTMELSYAEK